MDEIEEKQFVDTTGRNTIIWRAFCSECQNYLSKEEIQLETCKRCNSQVLNKANILID